MSDPETARPASFPFDAVVGHDDAKLALRLVAIDPLIGGVLLRGHKGSAKTTLARGLAGLLGDAPFVELPLGATEDRLVGSLDTRAALVDGEIRFHPGLLAAADGGVLYVDEINLLADHLVDVLLDVAVSGVNRVERDAVSHQHGARFVLVGSMNPEEGELRPQLLDRFGFCVTIETTNDLEERAEAVRRRLRFDRGEPGGQPMDGADRSLADVVPGTVGAEVIAVANRLAVEVGAEGLRADLTLCRAAAALAGLDGRGDATVDDVARVAPMVLAHRSRRGPFDPPVLPPDALDDALQRARDPQHDMADNNPDGDPDDVDDGGTANDGEPDHGDGGHPGRGERPMAIGTARTLPGNERRRAMPSPRGRQVGDEPAGPLDTIAVVATARNIAAAGARSDDEGALRTAVRHAPPRRTVVMCVDVSGSMGARERAEAATGTVLGLLSGAYERRDRVALVTFRGGGAEVVLSPTSSIEVARLRLDHLATGGETPLAEGLASALDIVRREQAAGHDVLLAVLSDGRATGTPGAFDRALGVAAQVARADVDAVVLDCETGRTRLGLAAQLAQVMHARLATVDPGAPHEIIATVSA